MAYLESERGTVIQTISWRINILKQEIISPTKRKTLTEPHYMFGGTLGLRKTHVKEHLSRWFFSLTTIRNAQDE